MANSEIPSDKREFRCNLCNGKILIPRDLPATTGPCPHCHGVITSPAPESAAMPVSTVPTVPVPQPIAPLAVRAEVPMPAAVPAPVPTPPAPTPPAPTPPAPTPAAPTPAAPTPATSLLAAEAAVAIPDSAPPTRAVIPEPRNRPVMEVPHAEDPSHANKRKAKALPESQSAGVGQGRSGLIPVMLVLLVVILGAGAAVYFVSNEMGRNVTPPTLETSGLDPAVTEANYIRVGWQKEAYQILRDYMAATSSDDKLPHIRNGEALRTRLDDFYGGGVINDSDTPADAFSIYELSEEDRRRGLFMMIYDQPPQFDMKEFFRPLASLEVQYGVDEADLLLSTLARVGNFAMEPLRVHAFFKRTPEGLKLDWEIFAQTKYRTFQNFVELPEVGHVGIFRVFLVEDVPDKSRLEVGTRTYRLADPANTSDTARVNVKVDSETGRALSIINWRGTKESRPVTRTATVELKWIGEANDPQLEISRFICWEFLGLGGQETPSSASAH